MSIHKKLSEIQLKLLAPKNLRNDFANFSYRSNEAILQALKPHLKDAEVSLVVSDKMISVGGLVYVEATTILTCIETGESISSTASAREPESRKGMDASQITGAASSYARKYCLNAKFAIDDNKDADSMGAVELAYTPEQKSFFDGLIAGKKSVEMFVLTKTIPQETLEALFSSFDAGTKTAKKAEVRQLTTEGGGIAAEWIDAITQAEGDNSIVVDFNESNKKFVVEYIKSKLTAEALAFFNEVKND